MSGGPAIYRCGLARRTFNPRERRSSQAAASCEASRDCDLTRRVGNLLGPSAAWSPDERVLSGSSPSGYKLACRIPQLPPENAGVEGFCCAPSVIAMRQPATRYGSHHRDRCPTLATLYPVPFTSCTRRVRRAAVRRSASGSAVARFLSSAGAIKHDGGAPGKAPSGQDQAGPVLRARELHAGSRGSHRPGKRCYGH